MIDEIIFGAIVVGLTEILKKTVNLNPRYIPLSTLIITFGIITLFTLLKHLPFTWEVVERGFIVALTAVGLWSGVRATAGY